MQNASSRPASRTSRARLLASALAGTALVAAVPGTASAATPPVPSGLTASIEALQPYVGQTTCDPVAKPGVSAWRDLLIRTYAGTGSLGIVRDCGIGGQSEHKEGRAFDWAVSASNPTQVAQVKTLTDWLLATDKYGNPYANLRRVGIEYMIWNHRIWKSYQADRGWQAYTGVSPHTDHVHFSFGWNGAKKHTSYWDGTVAAIDYGPTASPAPPPAPPAPAPTPVPVMAATPGNLAVLRQYGSTTLRTGSTGAAVVLVQKQLKITADGDFGPHTAAAVSAFQTAQKLSATGVVGPTEWKRLFPKPVIPFGAVTSVRQVPGGVRVTGWALDADTTAPIVASVTADGKAQVAVTAGGSSSETLTDYPEYGAAHGFLATIQLSEGTHSVCGTGVNASGTPGSNGALSCRSITVHHAPSGAVDDVTPLPGSVKVSGWALDPDSDRSVAAKVTVDGWPTRATSSPVARTDVATRFQGYGTGHGITLALPLAKGAHQVCVTAVNVPGTPGKDALLGCSAVTVTHPAPTLQTHRSGAGRKVLVAGVR